MAIGISTASAPTLFINIDINVEINIKIPMWIEGVSENLSTMRVIPSTAPDFVSPWLRIKTMTTVIVAGWAKPENTALRGIRPRIAEENRAINATIS